MSDDALDRFSVTVETLDGLNGVNDGQEEVERQGPGSYGQCDEQGQLKKWRKFGQT